MIIQHGIAALNEQSLTEDKIYVSCYKWKEGNNFADPKHWGMPIYGIFHRKSSGMRCYLVELENARYKAIQPLHSDVTLNAFPSVLKIHPLIYTYLTTMNNSFASGSILSFYFTPFTLSRNGSEKLGAELISILKKPQAIKFDSLDIKPSNPWKISLLQTLPYSNGTIHLPACVLKEANEVTFHRNSMQVANLTGISKECIVSMVHRASTLNSILSIAIIPRPVLLNYEGRGIIQSGRMGFEPYSKMGLTGKGQICGIADSGLNDISCFFVDDSGKYPYIATNRSGVVESERRKVIQYIAFADGVDEEG